MRTLLALAMAASLGSALPLHAATTSPSQPVQIKSEHAAAASTAKAVGRPSHKTLYVPVEKNVQLEVLDWGGAGPPLIFLAGNGDTAHVFDKLASLFTGKHHVYGITRRGFGRSGQPAPTADNYDSDRLGDDVLAVMDALKIVRPVIAGHSLAGQELSSIGTRHPERVAGLIYLDAAYDYAFYHPGAVNLTVDMSTMRRDLGQVITAPPSKARTLIDEMQALMPQLQKDLQRYRLEEEERPEPSGPVARTLDDQVEEAIFTSQRKYGPVKVPVLAIVAVPHECGGPCDDPRFKDREGAVAAQTDAFEAATPSARVVRIPYANHYVFMSNRDQVVREMNAFLDAPRGRSVPDDERP